MWQECAPFGVVILSLALAPHMFPRLWILIEDVFLLSMACVSASITWKTWGYQPILHTLKADYGPFMLMMVTLGLVASHITFHKGGKASPLYNTIYLAVGALASNLVGTMAAAMILWPPFSHLNRHQPSFTHGVVFFIFIVCNVGACLSPVGDPPLLVGFLRGVPFVWLIKHMWCAWLMIMLPLLGLFYWIDQKRNPDHRDPPYIIRMPGLSPFLMLAALLAMTIACPISSYYRELGFAMVALWAWIAGGRMDAKIATQVACLFLALFITLIPVQHWIMQHAQHFVRPTPQFYFWSSGLLSAFLDNTPTYIVWTGLHGQDLSVLAKQHPDWLQAISLGCVWMGALSYIGNAPNLVVRAFSPHHAPSFLGYMVWAWGILIPLFIIVSWLLW